jgi:hypothetical protein
MPAFEMRELALWGETTYSNDSKLRFSIGALGLGAIHDSPMQPNKRR